MSQLARCAMCRNPNPGHPATGDDERVGVVTSALVPVALGHVTHRTAVEQVGRALTKLLT
ncbi:hypothetical protein SKPI104516_12600 [Skermania piniformis]